MTSDSTEAALKSAAMRGTVQLFDNSFRFNLFNKFKKDVNPEGSLGDLLAETLFETLGEELFKGIDVVALYQSGDRDTKDYSQICKQALDLYLAKR
ncbi:hypothetical protein HZA97_09195 [Candidatus Woesearchaeota archaeon]|nr:hypothetical protein [Candidatus Woesearchaeota archaeon]